MSLKASNGFLRVRPAMQLRLIKGGDIPAPLDLAPRSRSLLGTRRHTSRRDREELTRGLEHPRAGRAGRHDCEVGALLPPAGVARRARTAR
jgi:hypothetical protein